MIFMLFSAPPPTVTPHPHTPSRLISAVTAPTISNLTYAAQPQNHSLHYLSLTSSSPRGHTLHSHTPSQLHPSQPHPLTAPPPHSTHIFNNRCTTLFHLTRTVQPSAQTALLEETAGGGTTVAAVVSRRN